MVGVGVVSVFCVLLWRTCSRGDPLYTGGCCVHRQQRNGSPNDANPASDHICWPLAVISFLCDGDVFKCEHVEVSQWAGDSVDVRGVFCCAVWV